MHILATFATLCCQTRWPRNHSCTTQEHVSFFRTFSGHFRKFRLFDTFCKKRSNLQIPCKMQKNTFHKCAHFCKTFSQMRTSAKTFLDMLANFCTCTKHKRANLQMCEKPSCTKCANLQRKLFLKCNFCTLHKNTNADFTISLFCTVHNFSSAQILKCTKLFSTYNYFFSLILIYITYYLF